MTANQKSACVRAVQNMAEEKAKMNKIKSKALKINLFMEVIAFPEAQESDSAQPVTSWRTQQVD